MRICILLLTLVIPWSRGAPPTQSRPENPWKRPAEPSDSAPGSKQPRVDSSTEDAPKCVYEGGRKTVDGKITRPPASEVSATCKGNLIQLSSLASEYASDFLGTRNELQLISVRGSAAFGKDYTDQEVISEYSTQFICEHHRNELSTLWSRKEFNHIVRTNGGDPKCSHPDKHYVGRPVVKSLNSPSCSVTLEEASAVMTLHKLLLPVGLPVCNYHKKKLKEAVDQVAELEQVSAREIDIPSDSSSPDAIPDSPSSNPRVSLKTVKDFRTFVASAGETRLTPVSHNDKHPISHLEKHSLQKKTCAARRLIDVIFEIIAKDDKKMFAERVMSPANSVWMAKKTTNKYNDLLEEIARRFYSVPGRREKEMIIAIIADRVPLREIRLFIPGLASSMFYSARRMKFIGIKLEHENPLISTDLGFGEKKVTASDGTKYSIPNSLRLHRATDIIVMYEKSMEARGLKHMTFARSTMYKLLNYCRATTRVASVCVDYFYSDSELSFEYLNGLVLFLHQKGKVSTQRKEEIEAKLKDYRFYLRGDYRLHTRNHSRVADHCWTFSLSDKTDAKFSRTCSNGVPGESHSHNLKCDRCELGKTVMAELRELLDELEEEVDQKTVDNDQKQLKEQIEDHAADLQQAIERIEEYKKHQIRGSFSYKINEIMGEESVEGTAKLVLDFGQKYLPSKHLEPQSDYFGKRGMSYHVTHIQTTINGRIATHTMDHIIENDQQDSPAVIQLIRHIFEELKKVKIHSVFLRSDNAGCYHSGTTVAAVYKVAKETGMTVKGYDYSEPQNGKSGADRGSGMFKNKVRAFVDAGGDASDYDKLFTAATSGRLLEGTSIYLVSIDVKKKPEFKLEGISGLFDFEFEEKGIRAWRHKNVGEGQLIPAAKFQKAVSSLPSLKVIKRGGHFPENSPDGLGFWKISPAVSPTCPKDDLLSLSGVTGQKPFHCPEITCSASFDSEAELEAHWLTGAHCASPMTATLRDQTLKMFSAGLENTISHRLNIPEVDDAVAELEQSDSDGEENVEQGWALKKRKGTVRFSDAAKKYVEKLFDLGITQKKKITAEEAEKRMAAERKNGVRVFSVEERLNARQISSLYSRIASYREKAAAKEAKKTARKTRSTDEKMEVDEEEEELKHWMDEEDDEDAVFEEASYDSEQDLIVKAIVRISLSLSQCQTRDLRYGSGCGY